MGEAGSCSSRLSGLYDAVGTIVLHTMRIVTPTMTTTTTTDTRETKMKRKGKRRRGDSDDEDLAADD